METGICFEMKKKKRVSQPRGLIRRSSLNKVKVRDNNSSINKKKKKQLGELSGNGEVFSSSIKPLFTTITKTTTTTTSIAIFTPPEDPNYHIDIYLCLKTVPGSGKDVSVFQWFKIDPTNTTVEAEVEVNAKSISKPKPKPKSEPVFLTPISTMPNTTLLRFCAIPHSSTNHKKKKKKLVYAIGGISDHSGKAFVCDFGASTNPPFVWEELPSMPCPIKVYFGAASPLNRNIYAFGKKIVPKCDVNDTYTGVVFDQASRSWNPCPHPFETYISSFFNVMDYVPVHTKDRNELIVFNEKKEHVALDLTTGNWKSSFCARVPKRPFCCRDEYSSCVAVGDVIYGFVNRKLYALDLASKRPRFKRVYCWKNL